MSLKLHDLPENYFRVSIKSIIFDKHNRIQVFSNQKNEYEIPGGGLNHNETIDACITRELREEVGAHVESIDSNLLCTYTDHEPPGYYKLVLAFKVTIKPGELMPSDDGLIEYKYVNKADFLKLPFQQSEKAVLSCVDKIWPTD